MFKDHAYIERILRARVYDVAIESPLQHAPLLSRQLGVQAYLKREDMQPVFSFKNRGAYNRIAQLLGQDHLSASDKLQGVVAASAGNHAQGVALAAQKLGIAAHIVMPVTTPPIKVDAVRRFGANAVLFGDTYDDASAHANELSRSKNLPLIHPFDDPDTIAGQGTIGAEICRQHPDDIDAIFVPVGGGGLAAGIGVYCKYLRPQTRIIGVEPDSANSMQQSLAAGEVVTLDQVGIFADGVAVKKVGDETFRLCQRYLDDVVTVSVDETCAAIKDIFTDTRTLMEPAGALAVAGMKKYAQQLDPAIGNSGQQAGQRNWVVLTTGANINFDRLRHVAERAEIGEQREALFAVEIPEQPGAYRAFCALLGARNVTEFNYRYADARNAMIFVGVQIHSIEERKSIAALLREHGYATLDMTDNEMAKLHLRHLVGGRVQVENELLYRLTFPERPGALMHFLDALNPQWNISLFHYRNHGAAYGRVLTGIQVPPQERELFGEFLDQLGYHWRDETQNPAYQAFLR